MSVPNQYYGHGSQMSADMKAIIKRVRAKTPNRFLSYEVEETRKDGKTVRVEVAPEAIPPTPADRHRMSVRGFR